jgi:hypothetical protein
LRLEPEEDPKPPCRVRGYRSIYTASDDLLSNGGRGKKKSVSFVDMQSPADEREARSTREGELGDI